MKQNIKNKPLPTANCQLPAISRLPLLASCLLSSVLFFLFIFFTSPKANAQEIISGPQYRNATLNSVDVLSSHLTLLQAQAHYDKMLPNISYTTHFTPVRLFIDDGSIQDGYISRVLLPMSAGYGTVNQWGIFGGFQGDYVKVIGSETVGAETFEAIGFLGFAVKGFQLDVGITKDAGFNLDGNYEFAKTSQQLARDSSRLSSTDKRIVSMYHKSGIYVNAIYAQHLRNGPYSFSELKVNVQPLKKYLPKIFGLPFTDLIAYTPLSSYYNRYKDYYEPSSDVDPVSTSSKNLDLDFGSDDLFIKGFRPAITLQAYPKVKFKKLELAYNYFGLDDKLILGARTQLFFKGTKASVSFDTFISCAFSEQFTLAFSYSYNSPDNVTFIPLPNLHVFGIQLIVGRRETAKAIIPFAATILSKGSND